jgi:DNA topoisomerase-2
MQGKEDEHTALQNQSEKDLWCQDLDAFVAEWELQLKEEEDYQKTIRNTNRRASRKIGAGKNAGKGRSKAATSDTEYTVKPSKPNPKKGEIKLEKPKSSDRFLSAFKQQKPKKSGGVGSDGVDEDEVLDDGSGLSDDDFAALKASKPASKEKELSTSRGTSEQPGPTNARGKRAAAAAPKKWVDEADEESESDDGKFLGDVGAMVKGIGGNKIDNATKGRLSLFAMSRPDSSHGRTTSNDLPKVKAKPSKTFPLSDDEDDQTNYEMLAKSSPQKAPPALRDDLDSFLSEEDDLVITKKAQPKVTSKTATSKLASKRNVISDDEDEEVLVPKKVVKKAAQPKVVEPRDLSSDEDDEPKPTTKKPLAKVAKPAPKPKKAPAPKKAAEPKPVALSPAAKAYAAKQRKLNPKKNAFSDDEDDDVDMEESPAPQPAARGRGRPARAAAVAKPKQSIYIDDSDNDEMDVDDNDESAMIEDEQSEDDFDESD